MKRPLIGLAISAALLLLSVPVCGASALFVNGSSGSLLVGAGLVMIALGILGGITCFIWLLVVLVRGNG